MAHNDVLVRSAILETNEKQPDRFLFVGKFESDISREDFLFYLFEILSPSATLPKLKKVILDSIQKNFTGLKNELDLDLFETILQNLNQSLNNFAQKTDSGWVGKLDGVVGFIKNNEINIAQTGKVLGYIFRKGKISAITENSYSEKDPHPLKTFSDITSGVLSADDRIIIGNIELFNHLSLDRIRRTLDGQPSKVALEELYRGFKKAKIFPINALILEARDKLSLEDETISNLPDILSLGKPDEDLIVTFRKKYSPVAKKYFDLISKNSKIITAEIGKQSKTLYFKAKKGIEKSRKSPTGNTAAPDKTPNVKPQIEKIKNFAGFNKIKVNTFPYARKTQKGFSKFLKNSIPWISNLKVLLLPKNRKFLYGFLVLLLIMFGYLKIRANNDSQNSQKQEQQIVISYDKAKEAYDKAKEDSALGRTTDTAQFEAALTLAQKAQESNATKEKAMELEKEIQASLDKMTKTTRLMNPVADITFKENPVKIVLIGSDIFSFNQDGKIYSTNTEDKNPRLLASIGKENSEIKSLAYSSSENNIYIEPKSGKILDFDIKTKTQNELKLDDGSSWENAASIASFSSNLYLLDSDAGQIWKHTKTDTGYLKGTAYTNSKTANIKGALDLAVDGSIYVLKNDGQVVKFSRGALEPSFTIKNIPSGGKIGEPKRIFTDADTNFIFILDNSKNSVLKFNKSSGEFINQYTTDGTKIDDFAVNAKIQKLWLLSGNKLFKIDL